MSSGLIFGVTGVLLFAMAAAVMVMIEHVLRRILAFNVMGAGTFLVLVGVAQRDGTVDPVPQAMVLTGIVVSVAATALGVALARRLHALTGRMDLCDDPNDD